MATGTAPTQPTRTLTGIHNDLELYPDRLVLRRKDVFSTLFRGDRTIYLHEIAAVHLYECRFESLGKLRFDLHDRTRDPIVVEFRCGQHIAAADIKAAVETAVHPA